jgi:hypothetical protein
MWSFLERFRRSSDNSETSEVFNQYERSAPAHQNAINALKGWNSAFPEEFRLEAGAHHLYADGRIAWAIETYGSIENATVLEVGPMEGMHTFMLNRQRPARIDSIEANRLCFLRCLVTRQILDIDRSVFRLGDIEHWLRVNEEKYDLAIASGVLYHMADPAGLLELLALRSKSVFLWTHFFLDEAMPLGDVRRHPFSGKMETREISGMKVRYYERSYQHANTNASFCGGMKDRHFWMHRDDILELLEKLGFTEIIIQDENLSHTGGPCFSLLASKR